MYLYFNRNNGNFGKLGMDGIARVCGDDWTDHKRQAIEMLREITATSATSSLSALGTEEKSTIC